MNMIRIGRTSLISVAFTLSIAATDLRAQAVVPPMPPVPPVPPDISIHVQLPDLSNLDLPDLSDLDDILQNAITGIPDLDWTAVPVPPAPPAPPALAAPPASPAVHVFPAFPALPALPQFALQGPKPVPMPMPKVRVYTDRDNSKGTTDLYEQARNAIEQEQYAKALGQLDALIARFDGKSLADSIANRVDAAMYWKAYSLGKQRELSEALKTLETMQSRFAESRWLKDAMALKVEMMQASGQAVSPDSQTDEDIKLLALRGLMQSDPDRAVPMIEQLLSGSSSIKVKENALFVLSQSRSARAREILGNIAKGNGNPDLQMRAIRYLGVMNGPGNDQILEDAYRSSTDEAVKRAIIRSFMVSGNRARLTAIAGDANSSPALRGEAVQQLGVIHAGDELARLYARESAPEVKKRIIQGLFISRDATRLVELARAEKDMDLKKDIVQKLSLMKSKEATDYLVELLK
jgi:tetratricopeptide (TPR) repeat protein